MLATGNAAGCGLRTVILRHADPDERILICHADKRSPKIAALAQCAHAGWLFYHPRKMIQVRIHGTATVHTSDATADRLWKQVKGFSRLGFCAAQPPGTPIDRPSSGLPRRLANDLPRLMDGNAGRDHFAAIIGRIEVLDWLQLRPSGNVRARFHWQNSRMDAGWVVP